MRHRRCRFDPHGTRRSGDWDFRSDCQRGAFTTGEHVARELPKEPCHRLLRIQAVARPQASKAGQRYRETLTFGRSPFAQSRCPTLARQSRSSLEHTGHIASKSCGNLFKNEHRGFSFVICLAALHTKNPPGVDAGGSSFVSRYSYKPATVTKIALAGLTAGYRPSLRRWLASLCRFRLRCDRRRRFIFFHP